MGAGERYEKKTVLGQGGAGLLYLAYDREVQRDVALKTIRDPSEPGALDLFRRECEVLSLLNHPNIVDVYDIGEMEDGGRKVPYLVMPLLEGATLDKLIRDAPQRLTMERVVDIIGQACRGLQAAHERGLIHRALKPANLFILNDDSVKIIDFGVALLTERTSLGGFRGDPRYLAPEQIELKAATPQSDIYSLGTICYEAMTRRYPFHGLLPNEIVPAILKQTPPPASEINPAVGFPVSQVVHAAMAKRPHNRFESAREFSEALRKALRNQTLERFDPARIEPRVARVERAVQAGEYEFAGEMLAELEAEGHLHAALPLLRKRIDQGLRDRTVGRLLDNARLRFDEEEHALALQKIQEALSIDPANAEAQTLKAGIEARRSQQQVDNWLDLARRHLEHRAFASARQAIENLLQLRPGDPEAARLLAEVGRREQEADHLRSQMEALYRTALDNSKSGDLASALSQMEKVLGLERSAPASVAPERSAAYQALYNQVRSEYEAIKSAYDLARTHLAGGDVDAAASICDDYLHRYPNNALFQALHFDLDDARHQRVSAETSRVDAEVAAEPDLRRRVRILEDALARNPGVEHFEKALKAAVLKSEMVESIVAKARAFEERGDLDQASGHWDILRSVHPAFPGIDFELERLAERRVEQARTQAKSQFVEKIDRLIEAACYSDALAVIEAARREFHDDPELEALEQLARRNIDRMGQAHELLNGEEGAVREKTAVSLDLLRGAVELDPRDTALRTALVEALLKKASGELDRDCQYAERLLDEACQLDPSNMRVRGLRAMVADSRRELVIGLHLTRARESQVAGQLRLALGEVEEGLYAYPGEPRLARLKDTLLRSFEDMHPAADAAGGTSSAEHSLEACSDRAAFESLLERAQALMRDPSYVAPSPQTPAPPIEPGAPAESATPGRPEPEASRAGSETEATQTIARALASEASEQAAAMPGPGPERTHGRGAWRVFWAAAAAGGAVLVASIAWIVVHHPAKPPISTPALVRIKLSVSPESARVRQGERDWGTVHELLLAPGRHELGFSADGFEPQKITATVTAAGADIPPVVLNPLPARLTLYLSSGTATLDRQPVAVKAGAYTQDLPLGDHTLDLAQPGRAASLQIRVAPGTVPEIAWKPANLRVLAVSSLGPRARILGPRSVDSQERSDLPQGVQTLAAGPDGVKVEIEAGPKPGIWVVVRDPETVELTVRSNEEGAAVVVDGAETGFIQHGKWTGFLKPGQYRIRTEKSGFVSPAEERIHLKDVPVVLDLPLIRNLATLRIDGPPGTAVILDGQERGQIPDSGTLEMKVEPGRKKVSLRKPGLEYEAVERDFRAGESLAVHGAELLSALGIVRLTFSPADANVSYQRQGERASPPLQAGLLRLTPGEYAFSAQARGHQDETQRVLVVRGEEREVGFRLKPVVVKRQPKPAPVLHDMTSLSGEWRQKEGGWQSLPETSGVSLLRAEPNGNVSFSVQLKGVVGRFLSFGERASWMAFYIDNSNHLLFELQEKSLTAYQVIGGRRTGVGRLALSKSGNSVQIRLTADRVFHRVGQSVQLETAAPPSLRRGKFGFKAPITIRDFLFETSPGEGSF